MLELKNKVHMFVYQSAIPFLRVYGHLPSWLMVLRLRMLFEWLRLVLMATGAMPPGLPLVSIWSGFWGELMNCMGPS